MVPIPCKAVINPNIRDSTPGWKPYQQPKAPAKGTERAVPGAGRHWLWWMGAFRQFHRGAE
jgi:hypothetical protein